MNWDMVKLGDLCEVLDTLRKPIAKKFRKVGKYPYYGATGIVDWVDDYIFEEELVLVGEDGAKWNAGEKTAFIVDGKYWVNNHAHVIKPNKDKLLKKWLTYYLCGIDLTPWITGLTVPKLNQEKLKSVPIPLPPLKEQQRIVAKLDATFAEIDKAITNIKKNYINSKKIFENSLTQFFLDGINIKKWSLKKLENYNKVVVGYVGPISKEYTSDENGILLLSTKNIGDNGINLDKLTRINLGFHNKNKKSQLVKGDIIVARHGNSGQAAIINEEIEEAHALNVIIIKKSDTLSSQYLSYLLNSGVLKKIAASKSGSVQEIINTSVIKNLIIPVPSEGEQQALIKKIDDLSNNIKFLEKIYIQKLQSFDDLKKSILTQELKSKAA